MASLLVHHVHRVKIIDNNHLGSDDCPPYTAKKITLLGKDGDTLMQITVFGATVIEDTTAPVKEAAA